MLTRGNYRLLVSSGVHAYQRKLSPASVYWRTCLQRKLSPASVYWRTRIPEEIIACWCLLAYMIILSEHIGVHAILMMSGCVHYQRKLSPASVLTRGNYRLLVSTGVHAYQRKLSPASVYWRTCLPEEIIAC